MKCRDHRLEMTATPILGGGESYQCPEPGCTNGATLTAQWNGQMAYAPLRRESPADLTVFRDLPGEQRDLLGSLAEALVRRDEPEPAPPAPHARVWHLDPADPARIAAHARRRESAKAILARATFAEKTCVDSAKGPGCGQLFTPAHPRTIQCDACKAETAAYWEGAKGKRSPKVSP